jgi:hypothetical protein
VKAQTIRDIGTDGARHGAGAALPLCMSRRSVSMARTVRDGAGSRLLCSRPRPRLPEGTPSGRRDPSGVLASVGHPRCL